MILALGVKMSRNIEIKASIKNIEDLELKIVENADCYILKVEPEFM